ncbi:MAG: DUF333 domain-containing protein [Syntrophothermus sp.]
MKTLFFLPVLFFSFFNRAPEPPMPDHSILYCKFLGYPVTIRKDEKGNEYAVCTFPDGTECSTWEFYRGACGKEYSYCSRKGCETYSITEEKDSFTIRYCSCGCKDSLGREQLIRLDIFMKQNGDTLYKPIPGREG